MNYSYTQEDVTYEYYKESTFDLISERTYYSVKLIPHNFTVNDGVRTDTYATLQIISQCGQEYHGEPIDGTCSKGKLDFQIF